MYRRRNLNSVFCLLAVILLIGCAGTPKKSGSSGIAPLEKRISLLESQIRVKDLKIAELSDDLDAAEEKNRNLIRTFFVPDHVIEDSFGGEVEQQQTRIQESTAKPEKKQKVKISSKDYYYYVMGMQIALRNAGFDMGLIDGKMGKRTHKALMDFQLSHGLSASHGIDKRTWSLLRKHLAP